MKIGSRLHELRRRRKLSTRELGLRSGVSHATISLVERDKISPSVDSLNAILDALGTTLSGFFLGIAEDFDCSPFYLSDELPEIGNIDGISNRVIGMNYANRSMLFLHETYAPNATTGDLFSHNAEECGMILRGTIRLTVADKTRVLGPGDGYYFDSHLQHRFENTSTEHAEIVSAVTPPTY